MAFDIGKLYRQLSAKIKNSSDSNSNNKNNSKKAVSTNSKFLFNNYNNKPTVLNDTPAPTPEPTKEAPVVKYAMPNPEPTKEAPVMKYAVPQPTISVKKYAVPDLPVVDESVKIYAVPNLPDVDESVKKYAVPDLSNTEPTSTTQTDTTKDSNPFESSFTKFLRNLFK